MSFRNQKTYNRHNPMVSYRQNKNQYLQRSNSSGNYAGPSNYESASKRIRQDSADSATPKANPVMENMVTSTNNEVVYKFTGPTPAESFEVKYNIEERVKAAAFAIVYNNCKVSSNKFEYLYDKPAPDFKTIYAWRQRLLITGCLVDGHIESKPSERPGNLSEAPLKQNNDSKVKVKVSNPEEIPVSMSSDSSDSSDEDSKKNEKSVNSTERTKRSESVETLVICGPENNVQDGTASTAVASKSQTKNSSEQSSGPQGPASVKSSQSRDSQGSDDMDTDSEKSDSKRASDVIILNSDSSSTSSRHSTHSDSASMSDSSDEHEFLQRAYKNKSKIAKHKSKKKSTPVKPYVADNVQNPAGYGTATISKDTLTTNNIYSSTLQNMTKKRGVSSAVDTDSCSIEYVPTKIGFKSKQNYQAFKDNVKRKGYWAKANGQSFSNKPKSLIQSSTTTRIFPQNNASEIIITPRRQYVSNTSDNSFWCKANQNIKTVTSNNLLSSITKPNSILPGIDICVPNKNEPKANTEMTTDSVEAEDPTDPEENLYAEACTNPPGYATTQELFAGNNDDFTNDDFTPLLTVNPYSAYDTIAPAIKSPEMAPAVKSPEDTSKVFELVQSSPAKNKSILDIFDTSEPMDTSKDNDLEKCDSFRKKYESEWDETDDALYGASDKVGASDMCLQLPKPGIGQTTSPIISIQNKQQELGPHLKGIKADDMQNRHKNLMDTQNDFKDYKTNNGTTCKILTPILGNNHMESNNIPFCDKQVINKEPHTNLLIMNEPVDIPMEISNEIIRLAECSTESIISKKDNRSPSKKIHIIESVVIKPKNCNLNLGDTDIKQQKADKMIIPPCENLSAIPLPEEIDPNDTIEPAENVVTSIPTTAAVQPQIDLSSLLSNINADALLLAIKGLQNITQVPTTDVSASTNKEHVQKSEGNGQPLQVSLSNDEEWEKESDTEYGSIERQLQELDGNRDTPFLSDIFDPGPIIKPQDVSKKLDLNLIKPTNKTDLQLPLLNENAPVIGNFKSFALPKPVLLNKLKVTMKVPDKSSNESDAKFKKKKNKISPSKTDREENENNKESKGTEQLKCDLYGSDLEHSSRADDDGTKGGESANDGSDCEKSNVRRTSSERTSKRRSSSSSSTSSSSSSSSSEASEPKNKFDDFNLNSEREGSPPGRKSKSPRSRSTGRRKSRDSRSTGETRNSKDYHHRARGERKERRYNRDGSRRGGKGRHR